MKSWISGGGNTGGVGKEGMEIMKIHERFKKLIKSRISEKNYCQIIRGGKKAR